MSTATQQRSRDTVAAELPHNQEAERATLGSMILNPSCIREVSRIVGTLDFLKPAHQRIYSTIVTINDRGESADLITICDQLGKFGVLENSGGSAYIARLTNEIPSSENAEYYARIVRDASDRRKISQAIQRANEKVAEPGCSTEDLVNELSRNLAEVQKRSCKPLGFRLERAGALAVSSPDWLIKGIVEHDQLAMVFGDPGTAKSFWAIDISCSIAAGKPWHGKPTKQGVVIFIAGEGQQGIARRIRAWAIANRIDMSNAPLYVALQPARLIDPDSVAEVIHAIELIAEEVGVPVLIVIDTLARNFGPGDENATPDMNSVIGAADSIRLRWHCAVLFTHHSGHADKTRSRGNSALRGALDTEFRLDKDERGIIRMEALKTKDGETPAPMAFRIHQIEIGLQNDEGEQITSAVLEATAYEPKPEQGKAGHGKWQTLATAVLEVQIEIHRKNVAADGRDPDTARVSVDAWQTACAAQGMDRRRFWDAKTSLLKGGFVIEENGYVELP